MRSMIVTLSAGVVGMVPSIISSKSEAIPLLESLRRQPLSRIPDKSVDKRKQRG
jgi:hypothetical protein